MHENDITPRKHAANAIGMEIVKRRKINGISQAKLAKDVGIPTTRLCKLERGWHLPHESVLTAIEQNLHMIPGTLVSIRNSISHLKKIKADTLTLADRLKPAHAKHSIGEEALQALRSRILPILDEYVALERKAMLPSNSRISLGNMRALTSEDGIAAAEGFRDALGAQAPSLVSLLPKIEQGNIRIIPVDDLPPVLKDGEEKRRDAFAFHDCLYDNAAICVNRQSPPYAQLYDIAYEIGAYLRYRRYAASHAAPSRREDFFCRAFAATLLMPEDEIRNLIDGLNIGNDDWSTMLMDNLALRFGVSSLALLWRLHTLTRIERDIFDILKDALTSPATFANTTTFVPRPPLPFEGWLTTLRLRSRLKR